MHRRMWTMPPTQGITACPSFGLATGPHSLVGYGSGFTRNRPLATGLTSPKSRTIGNAPVLSTRTRHFKFTILLQLSIWVLIIRWHDQYAHCAVQAALQPPATRFAIGPIFVELLSKSLEFLRQYGVFPRDSTNIGPIARLRAGGGTTAKLYNRCIHHVMMLWDLRYLIGAEVAATVKWNHGAGATRRTNCGIMPGPGNNPAKAQRVWILARSRTEQNWTAGHYPGR